MNLLIAEPILFREKPQQADSPSARLAIILVGRDQDSELYVAIKQREAAAYGVEIVIKRFPETITQPELIHAIGELNTDSSIDGVIVQLPLPSSLVTDEILQTIDPLKDVDSLSGHSAFTSPMVLAVEALVKEYKVGLEGENICVIGQGRLIGKPLTLWLESIGHQPVLVDEATEDSDYIIREADIIFAGSGQKYMVNKANTREGQTVFDCSGRDVDFEDIKDIAQAITPPKGSIGPLTVHYLLMNTLEATDKKK